MTITFNIYNAIDSQQIVIITMPWDYRKAVTGFYSTIWKGFKTSCASSAKMDKRFLRAKIVKTKGVTSRLEIAFRSGVLFNSPFDLNSTDFKIINLHLEALQLSTSKS
jgi:hypothetical protein